MLAALNDPETRTLVYVMLGVFTVIAIAILKLGQFLIAKWRDGAKEMAEWREFPGKHALTLASKSENGMAYEGKVGGFRVMMKSGASQAPQDDRKLKPAGPGYVCVAAQCVQPQPAGLQLWQETAHDAARKETRKLNEVIIGDMELDRALIIRGKQAAEIKALLCQPAVKGAVLEFFKDWPLGIVTDYWVKCEEDTAHAGIQSPEEMLEAALSLAKVIDQHAIKVQGLR